MSFSTMESGEEIAAGSPDYDELEEFSDSIYEEYTGEPPQETAPKYPIPQRRIGAVEVPMIVINTDRGVKAFGNLQGFQQFLDNNRSSFPFYLNPESPFCMPIRSHNASTHNVLLKVTVPKRTGRKRKKGSDGPFEGEVDMIDADSRDKVYSESRRDDPPVLRRKLQDNVGMYDVEPVGIITHTHRYRGLADFYWGEESSGFATRFAEQVAPRNLDGIKTFKLNPGIDTGPNLDIIPPPTLNHMELPFNYNYEQNPLVRAITSVSGGETVLNISAPAMIGYFVRADVETVPTAPRLVPDFTDAELVKCLDGLEDAFAERPIWTKRALLNRLGYISKSWNLLRKYTGYVGYQFRGGPFRDAVVQYGIDPREDPKYRIYQTMFFQLPVKLMGKDRSWHAIRKGQSLTQTKYDEGTSESHLFDGTTYYSDGKIWQVCDITDPFLANLFKNTTPRSTFDVYGSGWYHQGLWRKAKAVMKCKLLAVRFNRPLHPDDFNPVLEAGDETPDEGCRMSFRLPDLRLTPEELTELGAKKFQFKKRRQARRRDHFSFRVPVKKKPHPPGDDATYQYPDEQPASSSLISSNQPAVREESHDEHAIESSTRPVQKEQWPVMGGDSATGSILTHGMNTRTVVDDIYDVTEDDDEESDSWDDEDEENGENLGEDEDSDDGEVDEY